MPIHVLAFLRMTNKSKKIKMKFNDRKIKIRFRYFK